MRKAKARPGQINLLNPSVVVGAPRILIARPNIVSTTVRVKRTRLQLWIVFDQDGRVARRNPIEAFTGDQAISGFRETRSRVYLGKRPRAVLMDELIPGIQPGMTLDQAKGRKPFNPSETVSRLRFVVFDRQGHVLPGRQPIWVYSQEQAISGFSHGKTRGINPGSGAYAIAIEDIAGTADQADLLDPQLIVVGMTEQAVRTLVIRKCVRY